MPRTINEWPSRIKAVEREFESVRLAVDRLLADSSRDSAILEPGVELRDVRQASNHLSGTYIIRLFAEFETGLREYWLATRKTKPPTRTRDLLDGIAATRRIPFDRLENAHKVREHRNNLIHERNEPFAPISVAVARSYLSGFLGRLPLYW